MKRTFTKYPSNYVGAASETSGAAMRRKKGCGDIKACGVTASDNSESSIDSVAYDIVHNCIDPKVAEAAKDNLGFVEDDVFVYAIDEAVSTGSFSKCIDFVKNKIKDFIDNENITLDSIINNEDYIQDDIIDEMYDYDNCIKAIYDMGAIIRLFKKYNKFNDMPDWYFD